MAGARRNSRIGAREDEADEEIEMTKPEDRIRYLRRAAVRAEHEGNFRVARILRRMAADALPLGS